MSTQRTARAAVVPAIGTGGSLAVVRSLGRRDIPVIAISERERPPSFSSRYVEERIHVPSPAEDLRGYRQALLSLARRSDVASIIPVREVDIYVLAKFRASFADHVSTSWPTHGTVNAVHDRRRLFAAADRAGVAFPETMPLDEVDSWDRERIVKGRYAILTPDLVDTVPANRFESPPKTLFLEPGVEPNVDEFVERMGHVPLTQEYLNGEEYCFRALYRDGEPVATSQKKLVRGYKYYRGPSIYHRTVDIPALEESGLALLDELDWEGMASVGYIRRASGEFALLEVNPRVPASLPLDVHAGIDYPYYWWQLATERTVDEPARYRRGVGSHLLRGEIAHLHSVHTGENDLVDAPPLAKTVQDVATSIVTDPNFDYLSLDDPAPFFRDVLNTGRGLVSRQ